MQKSFRQGETILPSGQPPAWVGIVLSGLVKISTIDEQGNEHVLQLLHPGEMVGDLFGSPALFWSRPSSWCNFPGGLRA
ncbi:MAG: cyclic nucleotide-binding domain-containing protein [Rhodobacteraceae bacterium]|nr:cyclic nucleotide-binding domain-containing protein [Paracoccaceae bacterium]